jgi:hypothetical protein
VRLIRQKFALLILKKNVDDPRFARFQRLSASIGRFSTSTVKSDQKIFAEKTVSADRILHTGSYFRTELPLPASSVLEDRLDRPAEEARDLEGER